MPSFAAINQVVAWVMALSTVTGAFAVLWRILVSVVRIAARVDDIWNDWQGQPDRPGVPGRPGVMERLRSLEERILFVEAYSRSCEEH